MEDQKRDALIEQMARRLEHLERVVAELARAGHYRPATGPEDTSTEEPRG